MSTERIMERVIKQALEAVAAELDVDQLRRLAESDVLVDAIPEAVPVVAQHVVPSLLANAPDMLADRAGSHAFTREQVRHTFGAGLDICEMVLRIASEMGEDFADLEFGDYRRVPVASFTLAHLLARACRIAEETLLLLKNGWGLGAYARWRSMHEVAVTIFFIKEHGDEAARRFVEHRPVQRWRMLRGERDRFQRLGEPVPGELLAELAPLEDQIAGLRNEFGRAFLDQYGWAADALGIPRDAKRGPTLQRIEQCAGFGHLRRYYQEASTSVHPVPSAVLEPRDAELLGSTRLSAPSLSGIVTPAHALCLTLTNCTGAVLLSRKSYAAPFVMRIMMDLSDRAADELERAWKAYEVRALAERDEQTTGLEAQ